MMSECNQWMCLGGRAQRGGVQRSGFSVLLQSRKEVSRYRWMCSASIVFLLEWLVFIGLDCCCLSVHLVLLGPCVYCDAFHHTVSSLLLCVHLSSSPVFFLFHQCRHPRIRRMVPGTQLLSSSTLVGGLLFAPRFP